MTINPPRNLGLETTNLAEQINEQPYVYFLYF